MQQIKPSKTIWYIISDLIASVFAWIITTHERKILLNDGPLTYAGLFTADSFFYQSLALTIILWLTLFAIAGAYNMPLHKRLKLEEFAETVIQCFFGSILLLFILFLNDNQEHYTYFYIVFFTLFILETLFVTIGRMFMISNARNHFKQNSTLFNTIIIGNNAKAVAVCNELKTINNPGYNVIGFISLDMMQS